MATPRTLELFSHLNRDLDGLIRLLEEMKKNEDR